MHWFYHEVIFSWICDMIQWSPRDRKWRNHNLNKIDRHVFKIRFTNIHKHIHTCPFFARIITKIVVLPEILMLYCKNSNSYYYLFLIRITQHKNKENNYMMCIDIEIALTCDIFYVILYFWCKDKKYQKNVSC